MSNISHFGIKLAKSMVYRIWCISLVCGSGIVIEVRK